MRHPSASLHHVGSCRLIVDDDDDLDFGAPCLLLGLILSSSPSMVVDQCHPSITSAPASSLLPPATLTPGPCASSSVRPRARVPSMTVKPCNYRQPLPLHPGQLCSSPTITATSSMLQNFLPQDYLCFKKVKIKNKFCNITSVPKIVFATLPLLQRFRQQDRCCKHPSTT